MLGEVIGRFLEGYERERCLFQKIILAVVEDGMERNTFRGKGLLGGWIWWEGVDRGVWKNLEGGSSLRT